MVPIGSDEKAINAAGLCDTLREKEQPGPGITAEQR